MISVTRGVRDLEQYYCGLPFRHRLQFFLLLLDTYNLSLWYISRAVEVLSKLFVICTLMFHVFNLLKIFGDRVDRDPLTQIYNRKYFMRHFRGSAPSGQKGDQHYDAGHRQL